MFKNYIKIALRVIIRNKVFSFINILGLIIGFTAVILIYAWVQQELQYDNFHVKQDNIYRLTNYNGFVGNSTGVGIPAPLTAAIKDEVPAIVEASRLRAFPKVVFKVGESFDYETRGFSVDSSFFNIFSFKLIEGNPKEIFPDPFTILISKSLAKKYFQDKNPVGESIKVENMFDIMVAGVFEDVPKNSHLQFDYLVSTKTVEVIGMCGMQWGDFNFRGYVLLNDNANVSDVVDQINQVAINHKCPQVIDNNVGFNLQALKEIYLNPLCTYDYPNLGNKDAVVLFSMIAILIIFIASFNYINLSTAKSEKRAKEAGLRKIVGAKRSQVTFQFIGESLFIALIALNFAIVLSYRLFPLLSKLLGKTVDFNFTSLQNMIFIVGVLIVTGLMAGLYPALLISRANPIQTIKSGAPVLLKNKNNSKAIFRQILVVSQFTIAIVLIISTTFIYKQIKYIQHTSWHLDKDMVMHLTIREEMGNKYNIMKDRLLKNPIIKSVSIKDALPTEVNNNTTGVWWDNKKDSEYSKLYETIRVGYDYFETMDIKFKEGRTFSPDFPTDSTTGFILNEEALRMTGIKDPLGKTFGLYNNKGQIIGIVENTLFQTAKDKQRPQVFYFLGSPNHAYLGSVFIRIDGNSGYNGIQLVISDVRSLWNEYNKNTPFEYGFLDETIYQQYKKEDRLGKLLLFFAALAIFISSLGMLGLTFFMIESRTKEIGIRKINGAMPSSIVKLILQEFIKNIIIASVAAWIISYYFIHQWLQDFAFRTKITPTPFIMATLIALLIAIITIWILVIKAANKNPAESLRYE